MTAGSGVRAPRLYARLLAHRPGASLMVAALVAITVCLAVLTPRALETVHTRSLAEGIEAATPSTLALAAETLRSPPELGPPPDGADPGGANASGGAETPGGTDPAGEAAEVWGAPLARLGSLHAEMPEPMRGTFSAPEILARSLPVAAAIPGATGGPTYRLQVSADPGYRSRFELVEGDWPAPVERLLPDAGAYEVVLSEEVAETMSWSVGEERLSPVARPTGIGSEIVTARLAGIVRAHDPDSRYWSHAPTALRPSIVDNGLAPPEYTGMAYVDPGSWLEVGPALRADYLMWFELSGSGPDATESGPLTAQLREYASQSRQLDEWTTAFFDSGLREILAAEATRSGAVDAVILAVASGPFGVAIAVLALGCRVVRERRRPALELLAARGASPGRLCFLLALEGFVIGLIPGALGAAAGLAATPAAAGFGGTAPALVLALTPAAVLAASATELDPLRRARRDLAPGGRATWRAVAEAAVLLAAAASVMLLTQRGIGQGRAGPDPLVSAAPLLLALAACVVTLRLAPFPLRWLTRRLRRRPSLTPFLGAARAMRSAPAGIVPVLAIVVGVAIAVFSTSVLATVRAGLDTAAHERVGADVRVSGTPLTEQLRDRLAAVDGVAETAPVYSDDTVPISYDGRNTRVTLFVVDSETMRSVQQGDPGATEIPPGLAEESTDPVPAVLSTSLAERLEDARDVTMDDHALDVRDIAGDATAFGASENWILIDRVNADPFVRTLVPHTALIRLEAGAGQAAVTGIADAVPAATVATPATVRAELEDRALTHGLVAALVAAIAISAVLMALAVILTVVAGARDRQRIVPLLVALGMRRRHAGPLVAWEVAPVAVTAGIAGVVLGAAMPFAVLPAVDLAGFTTAENQPAVSFDPLPLAGVIAAAAAVTILATIGAAALAVRADPARAIGTEQR